VAWRGWCQDQESSKVPEALKDGPLTKALQSKRTYRMAHFTACHSLLYCPSSFTWPSAAGMSSAYASSQDDDLHSLILASRHACHFAVLLFIPFSFFFLLGILDGTQRQRLELL